MRRIEARIAGLAGARRLGLALLGGAVLALAQAPVSWPVVLFLAWPVLLWLFDGTGGNRSAFATGWAAGVGFFAATLFWIVEPFQVDAATHGWMAPFALAGIASGLALFWGAAFGLARAVGPPGAGRILTLAAAFTLAEFARSHLLTGFPWALIAYSWTETPVMQAAAVFGPHGLGFFTLLAALLPGIALPRFGRPGAAVAAAALVALAWGGGAWRLARPLAPRDEPVVVRLVQPNAEQHLKWRADLQQLFWERHLAYSRAPAEPAPDVTIWSETAVPFVLGYSPDLEAEAAASAGEDGLLILGIRRVEANAAGEQWYNSLAILGPGGRTLAIYDKHHLVPFGEYIPFAGAIARLGLPALTTLTQSGFMPGPGPHLVGAPGLPPFLPLICYEAIFPHQMQAPEGRPEWMVQITNDAWFGSLAGPYQHLAQARMRAVEQGLPLARAANTGISAMIGPRGEVTARLELGEEGFVDAQLPRALPPTIYAVSGDWPWILGVVAIFGLTVSIYSTGTGFRRRR